MDLRQLVEARIRDFHQREAKGETRPAPESTGEDSLESALIKEIRSLRERARGEEDPEAKEALLREAQDLETQLMVLLESTGRPLAARALAERLRQP